MGDLESLRASLPRFLKDLVVHESQYPEYPKGFYNNETCGDEHIWVEGDQMNGPAALVCERCGTLSNTARPNSKT